MSPFLKNGKRKYAPLSSFYHVLELNGKEGDKGDPSPSIKKEVPLAIPNWDLRLCRGSQAVA